MKSITFICLSVFLLNSSYGQSWSLAVNLGTDTRKMQQRNDTIIVGGPNVLYISYDNGDNWNDIIHTLPQWPSITDVLWVGNRLFIAVSFGGIYVSDNLGQNWQIFDITTIPNNGPRHLGTSGGYLFIADSNPFLWRTPINAPNLTKVLEINGGIEDIATAPNGDLYISTSGTGVFRSSDLGNSWTTLNNGLPIAFDIFYHRINSIAISQEGDLYCGIHAKGVYKYDFTANTWMEKNVGIEQISGIEPQYRGLFVNGNTVLIGTFFGSGEFYLSTDGAESFTEISMNTFLSTYDIAVSSTYIFVSGVSVYKLPYEGLFTLTDVKDPVKPERFEVFPNPTTGNLKLTVSSPLQNYAFVVSDFSGRKIQTTTESNTSASEIDLSHLPAGMYVVTLLADNQIMAHRKVVKLER